MPNSIEDILVCIHDAFGHYTATERVRIGRAFRDKNLGTQLSDRIADMIHSMRRRA
jgi:hypothetical protein